MPQRVSDRATVGPIVRCGSTWTREPERLVESHEEPERHVGPVERQHERTTGPRPPLLRLPDQVEAAVAAHVEVDVSPLRETDGACRIAAVHPLCHRVIEQGGKDHMPMSAEPSVVRATVRPDQFDQGTEIERHGQGASGGRVVPRGRRQHRTAQIAEHQVRRGVAPPGFPATSVAFTVNVWVPSEVWIGAPSATGPAQVARPEPPASSAQS